MKKIHLFFLVIAVAALATGVFFLAQRQSVTTTDEAEESTSTEIEEPPVPDPVPAAAKDLVQQPSSTDALGGYDVLVADRGNNRLIELTPDKRIVWEYDFVLPKPGFGADDAFFADGGKTIIANLEEYQVIQQINYRDKSVVWTYGTPGVAGDAPGFLNTPDDAYQLPNGDVSVADIKNCRVIEISPEKKIVRQYGVTKTCGAADGLLNKPNGDTPLPNGHLLVSNIVGATLVELDENGKKIFSMKLPLRYPSDPQLTKAGNFLISDYSDPGKIIEITRGGNVVWEYAFTGGEQSLNRPSLAIELPNGNIMANDDFHHRLVVIDKQSKKIVWQYGVTGKPGNGPGQLNVPDGFDIIMRGPSFFSSTATAVTGPANGYPVGTVMKQRASLLNTAVRMSGFMLHDAGPYIVVSDESRGNITANDLPMSGISGTTLVSGQKYLFTGVLREKRLSSRNGYSFELLAPPAAMP